MGGGMQGLLPADYISSSNKCFIDLFYLEKGQRLSVLSFQAFAEVQLRSSFVWDVALFNIPEEQKPLFSCFKVFHTCGH
jgi:hypothetical protein